MSAPDHPTAATGLVHLADPAARKVGETLRAAAALRGFALHRLDDGGFLLVKWNLSKQVPTIAAARAFLDQFGTG